MFSFSDISFHVLASCSQHAFDKWAGPYKCTNQNLYFKSQLKYTPIRKCHHSTQCYIGRSEYFHVRFAINTFNLLVFSKTFPSCYYNWSNKETWVGPQAVTNITRHQRLKNKIVMHNKMNPVSSSFHNITLLLLPHIQSNVYMTI